MAPICEKLLECFTDGYQALTDLESTEGLSYHEIKQDLEQMKAEWEKLEKEETLPKIKETVEYFNRFTQQEPQEAEVEKITERAKELKNEFETLSQRHNEMGGRAGVDPEIVQKRYDYSKRMKNQIVTHGKNALIASVILGMILGGLIAWEKWNDQILSIVFGILIGGGATLLVGGLTYLIFTAVATRGVKKWEELQKRVSEFQIMDKIIDQKAQELYDVLMLLDMIASKEQSVKQSSIQLVKQCEDYISATAT